MRLTQRKADIIMNFDTPVPNVELKVLQLVVLKETVVFIYHTESMLCKIETN
jgi:hypothetical protein